MTETMLSDITLKLDKSEFEKYSNNAKQAVETISSRAGKNGQFLNWIGILPENQLKSIDALYEMAEKARDNKYTDLAVLGIGGSRHTTESLIKMIGKDANIHFYSSVDSESFRRFINTLDLKEDEERIYLNCSATKNNPDCNVTKKNYYTFAIYISKKIPINYLISFNEREYLWKKE